MCPYCVHNSCGNCHSASQIKNRYWRTSTITRTSTLQIDFICQCMSLDNARIKLKLIRTETYESNVTVRTTFWRPPSVIKVHHTHWQMESIDSIRFIHLPLSSTMTSFVWLCLTRELSRPIKTRCLRCLFLKNKYELCWEEQLGILLSWLL